MLCNLLGGLTLAASSNVRAKAYQIPALAVREAVVGRFRDVDGQSAVATISALRTSRPLLVAALHLQTEHLNDLLDGYATLQFGEIYKDSGHGVLLSLFESWPWFILPYVILGRRLRVQVREAGF